MTRGGKAALLTATFALAGCTTASHQLKIRSIADPVSALQQGDELAVARGQLALNNVGLALEAFRKVHRDQPSNPAPLVGIADCYSVMGRFDLAQSNLEGALALAPRDPALLMRLARVLDFEGQPYRAAQARKDAQAASPVPAAQLIGSAPHIAPTASVTIALPPAQAVPMAAAVARTAAAAPAPEPIAAKVAAQAATIAPPKLSALQGTELAGPAAVTAPHSAMAAIDPALPGAKSEEQPKQPVPPQSNWAPAPPSAAPAKLATAPAADRTDELAALFAHSQLPAEPPAPPRQPAPANEVATLQSTAPHLERLSPHEVALVTTVHNLPPRAGASRAVLSSAVRWLPLSPAGSLPTVQVLNGARSNGLAASARAILSDRGWRKIGIGDAPAVRQASVVYYPRSRARLAHSLAAQFGIRTRLIAGNSIVVVLGVDKVGTIRALR